MFPSGIFPILGLFVLLEFCPNHPNGVQSNAPSSKPSFLMETIHRQISDLHPTTFVLVRHAEKELGGKDPILSKEGTERAKILSKMLNNLPIHGIYSSAFQRTRLTAMPLAESKGIQIQEYSTETNIEILLNEIHEANRGKLVLLVGHSNTLPEFLNIISNQQFQIKIKDQQYDDLFIAQFPQNPSSPILHLKYGKETPN
ncbi:MAG: histidine phosphatase family protein [Saprospiraceae bacterium]|nr:histidine phosphatase family protein [Saprospiraceae bacterium]